MNGLMYYMAFVWLLSLSVMSRRFLYIVVIPWYSILPSCFWLTNVPLYHIVCPFISWWTFGWLYFLTLWNVVTVNICVQVFVWIYDFSYVGCIPGSELPVFSKLVSLFFHSWQLLQHVLLSLFLIRHQRVVSSCLICIPVIIRNCTFSCAY